MTKLSDLKENPKNTLPGLLWTIDHLLQWCGWDLPASVAGDPEGPTKAMQRGIYPYRRKPYWFSHGRICPEEPYSWQNLIVDDDLIDWIIDDIQEDALHLCQNHGFRLLSERRATESRKAFLLRAKRWSMRRMTEIRGHTGNRIEAKKTEHATHGPDYHSVVWYGEPHVFTKQQAAVVKLLWEAWDNRTPDIGQNFLLEEIESDAKRLRDVFRVKGETHKAWGTMIVESEKKGAYRLASR